MKYNHFKDLVAAEMTRIEALTIKPAERIVWPYTTSVYANVSQRRTLVQKQSMSKRFSFARLLTVLAIF